MQKDLNVVIVLLKYRNKLKNLTKLKAVFLIFIQKKLQ